MSSSKGFSFNRYMVNYQDYTTEELAADPWFRTWVKQPDAKSCQYWNNWLAAYPEKAALVQEARELVLLLNIKPITPPPGKADALWAGIQATQAEEASLMVGQRPYWSFMRVAAAVVLLIVSAWSAYHIVSNQSPEISIETAYGESRNMTLPDGSEVLLNANSHLSYHDDWDQRDVREVWLEGEAFFKVKKVSKTEGAASEIPTQTNPKKIKFIVHSQDILVEVLGTEFSINNRRKETKVVLQSGEVKIKKDKQQAEEVVMKPGEMITYSRESGQLTKTQVDPIVQTSWKDKLLIFNKEPVGDILARIEDTYGISVQCENKSILERRFTGSMPTDSVGQFFTKLSKLYDLKIIRKENTILIR